MSMNVLSNNRNKYLRSATVALFLAFCVGCGAPPKLGKSTSSSKALELKTDSMKGEIGFVFSLRFSDSGKSNDFVGKFGQAYSALQDSIPPIIKSKAIIVGNKKCEVGQTVECVAVDSSSRPELVKFYEVEAAGSNVLSYLEDPEIPDHFSTESKVGIIAITNMINLDDMAPEYYQNTFSESYSSANFYGFDTSKFDPQFCDEISGITNFREITELTSGQNFTICQESWAEDFKAISKNLVMESRIYTVLPEEISTITEIKMGKNDVKNFYFDAETKEFSMLYADIFTSDVYSNITVTIKYE